MHLFLLSFIYSFYHSIIHSFCLFFSAVTEDLLNVFVRFYPKLLTDDILAGLISPHIQNLRLVNCSKTKPSKFIRIFPQWVHDQAKVATTTLIVYLSTWIRCVKFMKNCHKFFYNIQRTGPFFWGFFSSLWIKQWYIILHITCTYDIQLCIIVKIP